MNIIQFLNCSSINDKIKKILYICKTPYFILLNSDVQIKKFNSEKIEIALLYYNNALCVSPFIYSDNMEIFPNLYSPSISKNGNIEKRVFYPQRPFSNTLYPLKWIGAYNKDNFIKVGDIANDDEYLMLLEFFLYSYCIGFSTLLWN